MNDLRTAVVWSAVQVTLVGLAAGVLYRVGSRRGPGAGAFVAAASLGVLLALPALAMIPLPLAWRWPPAGARVASEGGPLRSPVGSPAPPEGGPGGSPDTAGAGDSGGWGWSLAFWRTVAEELSRARRAPSGGHGRWLTAVAAVFAAGAGLGLLHLLLGAWAVHRWVRRSRRIEDPLAVGLAEALRAEMPGCRPAELREGPELTTAATVGWRRPLVLLPAAWRTWSPPELRAVLAHELAHVRRADYPAWVLARVSLAVYFYHPLVHWLTGRLHLQQELAADALGARLTGGRGPYLRALARLALRQEGQPPTGPVRAFLPARGTLMRRIHMLRASELTRATTPTRTGRTAVIAVLAAVAVGVAALRGPDRSARGEVPTPDGNRAAPSFTYYGTFRPDDLPPEEAPEASEQALPPFDLSYAAPDGMGVLAFRPAALFRQPALKDYARLINEKLPEALKAVGLKSDLRLRIEDIDQVVANVWFKREEKAPQGGRQLVCADLSLIRTVRPFDWKKQVAALVPEVKEVRYQGSVYYEVPRQRSPQDQLVLRYFYLPDDRTFVAGTEERLRAFIRQKPTKPPQAVWVEGWKQVEHDLVAVALNSRDRRLTDGLYPEEGAEDADVAMLRILLQSTSRLVLGCTGRDECRLRFLAECDTERDAQAAVEDLERLVKRGLIALTPVEGAAQRSPEAARLAGWTRRLLRNARIYRTDSTVSCTGAVKAPLMDVLVPFLNVELSR